MKSIACGLVLFASALAGCECHGPEFYSFNVTVTDAATGLPVEGVTFEGTSTSDDARASCIHGKSEAACAVWSLGWDEGPIEVHAPGYASAPLDVAHNGSVDMCGGATIDKTVRLTKLEEK